MAALRDAREALLMANFSNLIDDEEFLLLHDMHSSKILITLTGIMKNLIWKI